MTTSVPAGNEEITLLMNPRARLARGYARRDPFEREARVRRLVLVGALATFLSFFGLVVFEPVLQPATTAPVAAVVQSAGVGGTTSGQIVSSSSVPAAAPRAHVKTRSS